MAETRECDVCSSIVKHIPAGTSKKTGKPYNDFWVCSNDNCSSRQRSTQNTQTPPRTQPEASNGKQNAAVEMIYELQAIRSLLEDILQETKAGNTFFREVKNNKPGVAIDHTERADGMRLSSSEEVLPSYPND